MQESMRTEPRFGRDQGPGGRSEPPHRGHVARSLIRRALVVGSLLLFSGGIASLAQADVTIEADGRRILTPPKQIQTALDGVALLSRQDAPAVSGRTMRNGRTLRARPTEPVVVGLVGCPGCTETLHAIGGVFVETRWRLRGRR